MQTQVFLRKHIQNRIGYFHPWVYANEIGQTEGELSPGRIVDVFSHLGSFVGQGFYNPYASVRIKMFVFQKRVTFDHVFLRGLIEKAYRYRKQIGYQEVFRLFNSDGDGMPGLIIDYFPNHIVFQTLSLGIDYYKELLIEVLKEMFSEKDIIEQNEVFVRNLEGLRLQRVLHQGKEQRSYPYHYKELRFLTDPWTHEKTGIDWEWIALASAVKPFVKKGAFLSLFSGMGELVIMARHNAASMAVGVDYNTQQLELAHKISELNAVQDITWVHKNVFDFLKSDFFRSHPWEVVVVNPPAFIHKKEQLHKAYAAYKEMLIRILPQLEKDGVVLVAFPHYLYINSWIFELIQEVMRDVKISLKLLKEIDARWDHPNPASFMQNRNFKAFLWQVN